MFESETEINFCLVVGFLNQISRKKPRPAIFRPIKIYGIAYRSIPDRYVTNRCLIDGLEWGNFVSGSFPKVFN